MIQPPPQQQQKQASTGMTAMMSIGGIIGLLIAIAYHYGAARLSYSKYGSIGWAILAFIFAPIYYPVYALFLHTPSSTLYPDSGWGGMRKLRR